MSEWEEEYGRGLFLAVRGEEPVPEDWLRELLTLFDETPDYLCLLSSAAIPKRERAAALRQVFEGVLPDTLLAFLLLLTGQGKIGGAPACIRHCLTCLEEAQNELAVRVVSALPLTEEETRALEVKLERLAGRNVRTEYQLDETLIGGLVVEAGGRRLDGSLSGRLRQETAARSAPRRKA